MSRLNVERTYRGQIKEISFQSQHTKDSIKKIYIHEKILNKLSHNPPSELMAMKESETRFMTRSKVDRVIKAFGSLPHKHSRIYMESSWEEGAPFVLYLCAMEDTL